jgi:neutral ceramidase
MDAGYADVDITPAPGEEMTGYGYFLNRRATGTLDALMARAVALSDGQTRAVIVQLDLLALSKEFVAEVRAEAQRRFGLLPERLMLHCTHTHSGPGTIDLSGCGAPSEHFLFTLQEKLLTVIGQALEGLQTAKTTSWFETPWAEGFAYNREGGAYLDPTVRGVWLEFPDARPLLIISYACHPVVLGTKPQYSADYPGAVIREFNAYGIRAIYLNGPCGDINPLTHSYRWGSGTPETLLIYGRDMAQVVRDALKQAQPWEPGPLRVISRQTPLQVQTPTLEQLQRAFGELQEALRQDQSNHAKRVDVMWCERLMQLRQAGTLAEAMAAEIHAIACGDLVIVGLAAETFTRLGQIIRENSSSRRMLIAATTNGILGYIATSEDVDRRSYASFAACKIYGMSIPLPGAGEQWAAAGARIVGELVEAPESE